MKERNIATILWPKYKQNGAEVNYLKEKQRARSEIEYNFSWNMTSTIQARKVKYLNDMTIEGSYRWKDKPPDYKSIINPTKQTWP